MTLSFLLCEMEKPAWKALSVAEDSDAQPAKDLALVSHLAFISVQLIPAHDRKFLLHKADQHWVFQKTVP